MAAYQRIEDMSTAVGLTIPDGDDPYVVYSWAFIQAEGGTVRVRPDGVDPTSTTGIKLADGAGITIPENLAGVRLWAADSTPSANIMYGRRKG